MGQKSKLADSFTPISYTLAKADKGDYIELTLRGRRIGKPSKRLTFHQTGLKINRAEILTKNKGKELAYEVGRISHLPSFQEVRLHTANLQYPGEYTVTMEYSGKCLDDIKLYIDEGLSAHKLREYLPSIDDSQPGDITIEIIS